ncbi:MAG: DNA polymerase III subunit gamma/tau, partial [Chloroflexota bacterium]|nr:DNA polymerase III subunit gamma/tau [Chloroflexota bacterium]
MAEQVLYRKWRPQRFADIYGQDAVVQTLRQAVGQGRVAHAYLFCGPRGTGKTTAARILAKALNCDGLDPSHGPNDGDPDNTCPFCLDVNEGRALDLVEMDAASHRGIDDVRSLQERVFGAGPARGRAKVYIIDEVHMLTDFAFNALLKTLEEPAPWAYFVLCTTEPHKVLATIVSRCQRFDFRRISPRDVQARLEVVCEGEGYACEPPALAAIARSTGGSARDALNILEQTALSYGNNVTLSGVEELLGLSRDPRALELARNVLAGDLKESLRVTADVASAGLEPGPFHRELVERMRAVLLEKSGVGGAEESADDRDAIKEIAAKSDWDALLRAMRIVGRANVRSGEGPAWLPLELAVIEAATPPEVTVPPPVSAAAPAAAPAPQPRATHPPRQPATPG